MPVGTSNSTIPAVKNALAANAWKFERPASSRKIVLIPQISEAASVLPSSSTRYVRWIVLEVGIVHEGTLADSRSHRARREDSVVNRRHRAARRAPWARTRAAAADRRTCGGPPGP